MKTLATLVFLLFSIATLAQVNGINYKALIKDANGNVVNNTSTTIEFTIYKGAATFNTYRETHTIFTDSNGILIANIGEGTIVNGVFNDVNWSDDDYFLGVKIDAGAGFVDLGITAFKTVPYAIQATKATTAEIAEIANNVSGLEALDEGNGIGWRLIGSDPNTHGNIGDGAIDLTYYWSSSSISGATGSHSFATGTGNAASGSNSVAFGLSSSASGSNSIATGFASIASGGSSMATGLQVEASGNQSLAAGEYTEASGVSSSAFGSYTTASGINASAFGNNTDASGENAFALGNYTNASGKNATAIGNSISARSFSEFTIGTYNTFYTHNSIDTWDELDRLFVIGNGTLSSHSDALIVLKNGTITAPSFDLAEITDNKALITKEYADATITGLEAINESNGVGHRIVNRNPNHYGNIGKDATDLSFSSSNSTTRGATGDYSFAIGKDVIASGDYSMALGESSSARGLNSVALGKNARAWAYGSLAIGRYSKGNGSSTLWFDEDPIFEIGNGDSDINKKNALTVFKNGKMIVGDESEENIAIDGNEITALNNTISSNLVLQKNDGKLAIGNVTPDAKLHVFGGEDASLNNPNQRGYMVLGNVTGTNMVFDDNEIMARNNGSITTLHLQLEGGNVNVGGVLAHSSDRRLKKDISELNYGLNEVLQLQPKQYFWKNRTEQKQKSLGLIAQDVQDIISNIVHKADDEQKTLSVSYTELIPVLINAIKEQQKIIDNQNSNYSNLLKRIEALENNTINKMP